MKKLSKDVVSHTIREEYKFKETHDKKRKLIQAICLIIFELIALVLSFVHFFKWSIMGLVPVCIIILGFLISFGFNKMLKTKMGKSQAIVGTRNKEFSEISGKNVIEYNKSKILIRSAVFFLCLVCSLLCFVCGPVRYNNSYGKVMAQIVQIEREKVDFSSEEKNPGGIQWDEKTTILLSYEFNETQMQGSVVLYVECGALDQKDEIECFVNKKTGKIVCFTDASTALLILGCLIGGLALFNLLILIFKLNDTLYIGEIFLSVGYLAFLPLSKFLLTNLLANRVLVLLLPFVAFGIAFVVIQLILTIFCPSKQDKKNEQYAEMLKNEDIVDET